MRTVGTLSSATVCPSVIELGIVDMRAEIGDLILRCLSGRFDSHDTDLS